MALHVPKAPGFAQMLKDGAMVSVLRTWLMTKYFKCTYWSPLDCVNIF